MSISLDQLLSEADTLIEKRASSAPSYDEDDIFKLAEKLSNDDSQKELIDTPFEKIARAIAIIETVQTLNKTQELENFEKKAMENGYSEEEVDSFLSEKGLLPLHKVLTIPENFLC